MYIFLIQCFTRIFRIMGCPHGCGDSCHDEHDNQVESLRAQGIDLMTRLMKLNKHELVSDV